MQEECKMELWQNSSMSSIIVPVILIVAGLFTRIGLPRKVNWWVGYRTSMACKNQETWVFAHKHSGKLWIILGFVLLVLSIGAEILIDNEAFPWLTGVIVGVQLVAILLAIIPTELALRKVFDKNGERRQ
jgi:uncharacterized membrane protein